MRIDAIRTLYNLAPYNWTDPSLSVGAIIKRDHILDLRAAIEAAYTLKFGAAPFFTDPALPAGTPIKVPHILQIHTCRVVDGVSRSRSLQRPPPCARLKPLQDV